MTIKGDDGSVSYFSDSKNVKDGVEVAVATDLTPDASTGATESTPVADIAYITINGEVYEVPVGETFNYIFDLQAAELFEDIQATLYYDSDMVDVTKTTSDGFDEVPNLGDSLVYNDAVAGYVKFNSISLRGFDFTTMKNLITVQFTATAAGESEIYLNIEEMTIKGNEDSYFTGGEQVKFDGLETEEYSDYVAPTEPVSTEASVPASTEASVPASTEASVPASTEASVPAGTTEASVPAGTTEATVPAGTTTVPAADTDPTSTEDATTGTPNDAPSTGGVATYVYIVLAVLALAACAVVVLRKKAND